MSMSNETELRAFSLLEATGQQAWSKLPQTLRRGPLLSQLFAAGILRLDRSGPGKVVVVAAPADFRAFLDNRFPGRHSAQAGNSVGNLQRYRYSKAGTRDSVGVVLLRGWGTIRLNGQSIELGEPTATFGCLAALKPRLRVTRLCLVENLDCFVRAEQLLGRDWTFAHTYGRLGSDTFTALTADEVLHFGDYDYTGLAEFLRLREQYPHTRLYLPDDLEVYWQRYATPLKEEAVAHRSLRASDHPGLNRVLELLARTNRFLEQQALFTHLNPTAP